MSDQALIDTFVKYAQVFSLAPHLANKTIAFMRIKNVEPRFYAILATLLSTPEHVFFMINEFLSKKIKFHIFNPHFKYPRYPAEFQILNSFGFFITDYDDSLAANMIRGFMHCQTLLAVVPELELDINIKTNYRPYSELPVLTKDLKYRLAVNYLYVEFTAPLHWQSIFHILYNVVKNVSIRPMIDPPIEEVKEHIAQFPDFDEHLYEINSATKPRNSQKTD